MPPSPKGGVFIDIEPPPSKTPLTGFVLRIEPLKTTGRTGNVVVRTMSFAIPFDCERKLSSAEGPFYLFSPLRWFSAAHVAHGSEAHGILRLLPHMPRHGTIPRHGMQATRSDEQPKLNGLRSAKRAV